MATRSKARKYKKVSCHTTVSAARKKVKQLRNQGKTASLRGKCVYSAGPVRKRRKTRRRRRA